MLVNEVGVRRRCGNVLVERLTLTSLTTITGDGCLPHLVEKIDNGELCFVDVLLLFVVVVVAVIAFHLVVVIVVVPFLLLDVVVVVVLAEFVVLNLFGNVVVDIFIELASLIVVFVISLHFVVPLFSVEVVVEDVVVDNFCAQTFG